MKASEIKVGDTIKIEYTYKHGLETFSESKTLTVRKITPRGNFQVTDQYGTGSTISPAIFDNENVSITILS